MSSPFPPFGSQDLHDDDGQVIDSFFVETDTPPDLKEAAQPVDAPAVQVPKRTTRIFPRDFLLDPANTATTTPVMLFPADASRKNLGIRVTSPTAVATDGIRVASDLGEVYGGARIFHGQDIANGALTSHTGAVYVLACGNGTNGAPSAPVLVEAWSVSE